jgi:hypothetical protein
MSRVFIHIGYPKCLSTTLQRSFFEKHPEINYFGVGIGDNISYRSKNTEFIFEILLKYSRRDFFEKHFKQVRNKIEREIDSIRPNLFSSEHLLMNFSLQGIDPEDKMERLSRLFQGHHTEVIIVYRERDKLIRSLYGEMIRMGYYETYEVFQRWIEKFKDRNFYYDLDKNCVNRRVNRYFSKVHWVSFENLLLNATREINESFSKILSIQNVELGIENNNPSLNDVELEQLRLINANMRRELGESALTPFEHHRNRSLFDKIGIEMKNEELYLNVIQKRAALQMLQHPDKR